MVQPRRLPLQAPSSDEHVPGQYIVRFKAGAVQQVASNPVARTATARSVLAAMPDNVAGPLDLIKEDAGLIAVKPLFVTSKPSKQKAGTMALANVHRSLAKSATETPRESLRGFQLVETKSDKLSSSSIKKLQSSRAVDFVEPVPNRWLSASEADPLLNRQWGLRAIRWFVGKHPDATAVHVAVLDSGIDEGHEDLKDSIEEYVHDGNKARDFLGHGTHVSGIIAAAINNAVGICGIANCRLHCWKIFDDPATGSTDQDFNFAIYSRGLASALDTEIKVINLSIGGTASSKTEATIFRELRANGVVVVAAMGNEFEEGNPKEFPAAYDGVLAVGAVDETDRRAPFSCTGAHIGLVAPGVSVLSTVPRQKASFAETTDYDSWPGTSMATPHVAGATALLYARRSKSNPSAETIVKRLQSTAKKLAEMKKKAFTHEYGSGLLDLAAALKGS